MGPNAAAVALLASAPSSASLNRLGCGPDQQQQALEAAPDVDPEDPDSADVESQAVEELLRQAFEYDDDKDGKLNLHEFSNWIHSHPDVLNVCT